MTPPLDELSIELFECIIHNLEIAEVGALRLVSRAANSRILRTRWPECFRTKRRLWLDAASLESFVHLTATSRLVLSLENLTVIGAVVESPDEQLDETAPHRALLAKAFGNLKAASRIAALKSLALTVALRPEDDMMLLEEDVFGSADGCASPRSSGFPTQNIRHWPYVWDLAQKVLAVTLHALGDSCLGVSEQLDLFMAPQGCSLYLQKFVDLPAEFPAPMALLRGIKELKVSLSPPMRMPEYDDDGFVVGETEMLDSNGQVVPYPADVLQDVLRALMVMAPALETFDLHWFSLNRKSTPPYSDDAPEALNKHLRCCTLRGLSVSDEQLLAFLKNTRPARLHLEHVRLHDGAWSTVLKHVARASSGVEAYVLDDLFNGANRIIHFEAPGHSKFPYRHELAGPNTLVREEGGARLPVHYYMASDRALGSGSLFRWRSKAMDRFGSSAHSYNFAKLNPGKRNRREDWDGSPVNQVV